MSYYGSALLVGSDKTPFITAYQFTGGVVANGFAGTYANPLTLPTGTVNAIAFSPNGQYVAFALATSPYISVYPWNNATGFGAKVADPVTLPDGAANYVAWSPDGSYVGVATAAGTFEAIYPFSGGALGARVSAPGTVLPGACNQINWSPDGAYVGFASNTTPYIVVYNWSAGYGSKVSDPGTGSVAANNGMAWNPAGTYIVSGGNGASGVLGYPWSAGFGARFVGPAGGVIGPISWSSDGGYATYIIGATTKVGVVPISGGAFGSLVLGSATFMKKSVFKPTSDFIAATGNSSNRIKVYPWSAGSLGTPLANPSVLPPVTSTAAGVAWALDTVAPPPSSSGPLTTAVGPTQSAALHILGAAIIPTLYAGNNDFGHLWTEQEIARKNREAEILLLSDRAAHYRQN